ncbi:fimbrillin family protein [Bacteroides sp. HF-5092]|uniref:fimbrillin family protein n=1 Tax=Bacteroides TaxID=816 RepID=UPI001178CDE0|nr:MULTISPECIES: fimbrillin family protein [Bacteroides]TRX43386.1 fimbrillin family protein [Bacteroides sp. HF-5092]
MKPTIHTIYTACICLLSSMAMVSCGQEETAGSKETERNDVMQFRIAHPSQQQAAPASRATETDFETNDRIGLFVCGENEPLQVGGNYVNNASLTYNGTTWTPARPIYWNDGSYDVYAYYPFSSPILSTDEMEFRVAADQSATGTTDALGGYEASDFLWASAKKQTAGNDAVALKFKHCMSKLTVRLIKGEDYEGDELPQDAEVFIHNTVPNATIDLAAGIATKTLYGTEATLKAKAAGDNRYTAIVVPQRITNRRPLVEVVMKGVSYLMESAFVFKPGMHHIVSLTITKNPEQVKIEIGGEIENWETTEES